MRYSVIFSKSIRCRAYEIEIQNFIKQITKRMINPKYNPDADECGPALNIKFGLGHVLLFAAMQC